MNAETIGSLQIKLLSHHQKFKKEKRAGFQNKQFSTLQKFKKKQIVFNLYCLFINSI